MWGGGRFYLPTVYYFLFFCDMFVIVLRRQGMQMQRVSRDGFLPFKVFELLELLGVRGLFLRGTRICKVISAGECPSWHPVLHFQKRVSNDVNASLMPSSSLHPPPFTTSASSPHLPSEAARRKRNAFGSGNNGGSGGSGGGGGAEGGVLAGSGGGGLSDSGSDIDSISSSSSTTSLPSWASGGGMLHPSSFAPPFYNRPPTVLHSSCHATYQAH